jgi:hypothetical protein
MPPTNKDVSKAVNRLKSVSKQLQKRTMKLKNIKPTKQGYIQINVKDSKPLIYKGGKNTRKNRKKRRKSLRSKKRRRKRKKTKKRR